MEVTKIKVNDNMSEEVKAAGTELINVGGNADNGQDKNKKLKLGEVITDKDKQGGNNDGQGSEFSEHFGSQKGKSEKEQEQRNSEVSVVVEEEDASDLLYDKELKLLLEDHKRVMKFTMLFSMAMLFA